MLIRCCTNVVFQETNMQFQAKHEPESISSPWNDRILMAAVIVTMVLSLLGYMHA